MPDVSSPRMAKLVCEQSVRQLVVIDRVGVDSLLFSHVSTQGFCAPSSITVYAISSETSLW